MRGRLPVPTALKIARGNPGHRPIVEDDLKIEKFAVTCPSFLSDNARLEWNRLIRIFPEKVITEADQNELAVYCEAWAEWRLAVLTLEKDGRTQMTGNGYEVPTPWIKIKRDAEERIKRGSAAFGLTPSDRCRIKLEPPAPEEREKSSSDDGMTLHIAS